MTPAALPRRHVLIAAIAVLATNGCAAPVGDRALVDRLRPVKYVLLGEVHDNAGQHARHAALITALLADGRATCVVFEQFDRGVDAAIAAAPRDAESVATAGRLDRRGWAWPMHRPVIAAALAGGASLRGGNLSRDDARSVVRSGIGAVPADAAALLKRSNWLAADQAAVEREIEAGHCGALPPKLFPAMALAERARDATLAQTLLDAGRTHDRVILVAGNGHVRRDLGVPRYLLGAGVPGAEIMSVGFLESDDGGQAYDQVRVTPAAERPDPCEAFTPR